MRPRFTSTHKRQLRNHGVTTEQVEALEMVLPRIYLSAQSVRMSDVRGRLQDIANAAHALAAAIKRLSHGVDPADNHALWRLYEAHSNRQADDHLAAPLSHYPDNPDPQALRVEIERLEGIANAAMEPLRGKQARARTASPWPVSWIGDALLEGWTKCYSGCVYDTSDEVWIEQVRNGTLTEKSVPDYPFMPSQGGAFREIVSICYQAAGHPTADPERAIKTYLNNERKRRAWMDENSADKRDTSP